jgi:hypothetical protein
MEFHESTISLLYWRPRSIRQSDYHADTRAGWPPTEEAGYDSLGAMVSSLHSSTKDPFSEIHISSRPTRK